MTNEEFFEKVKGKKIKWSGWVIKNDHITPSGITGDGLCITYINSSGKQDERPIRKGFEPDENGNKWEFYEDPKQEKYFPDDLFETFVCDKKICMHPKLKAFWMVFVDCQKIPQCKHDTYESAKEEAERLAKKSGAEVALIECVSIKKCKAVKKVEWEEI